MQDRYRLPRSVIPSRYDLTIEPDLEAATFSGTEAVTVEVHERIDEIVINALDLAIDNGWLSNAAGTRIEVSGIAFDEELQRATLGLADPADPGSWTLHLAFRGELNDQLHGFYRSTFTGADGDDHTSRPRSSRRSTPAARSRAGTSRTSRPCSP